MHASLPCKDCRGAWSKIDQSRKCKMSFSCMIMQNCIPICKQKPSQNCTGLCCLNHYTAQIWPHQTFICLVQWKMPSEDRSLGMTTRLLGRWRCGSDTPQHFHQQGIQALLSSGTKPQKRWRLHGRTMLVNKVCDYYYTKFQLLEMISGQEKKRGVAYQMTLVYTREA
jgi:hypothetical protein